MPHGNILEITDFSQKEFMLLIKEAIAYKQNIHRHKKVLQGKRVCLLFDSSSLRTRLSFESAMHLLGGTTYFIDTDSVLHEKDGTPRETYEDIIESIDRMVDAYVVRDYSQNMLEVLKRKQYPPIINGFCQTGHPSQALADLSVILWKKGTWKLHFVAVCPSEGSGVIESFVYAVLLLGQHITLITPSGEFVGKNLGFHKTVKMLSKYGGKLTLTKDIHTTMKTAAVLYVDEWWENKKDFLKRQIGKYQVDKSFLKNAKKNLVILHCLPAHHDREIAKNVIYSPQSIIFDQAEFRVYSAMALLKHVIC
ncbi:hypothetical protein HZC31_03960 [Candidatus Woesearchaeota archaeon]|nr:hypothetical protein [Candidatus Woesearchaeota archaeon]